MRYLRLMILGLLGVAQAAAAGDHSFPSAVDGTMAFNPPSGGSCLAIRVQMSPDKAISGVRWYDPGTMPFARILLASGEAVLPPQVTEAREVVDSINQAPPGWREAAFDEAVASEDDGLYVIFEYPSGAASPETAPGIGYVAAVDSTSVFLSGDGETWIQWAPRCQLFAEPVLVSRTPATMSLSAPHGAISMVAARPELSVSPNPFNPETQICLRNARGKAIKLVVYDLLGRRVRTLFQGVAGADDISVSWNGRDDGGRKQSSGVYFIKALGQDIDLRARVVMVK